MNIEIQIPDWLRQVTVRIDAEGNFCMTGKVVERTEAASDEESPEDRKRRLNRERQQRYRNANRNALRDKSVTQRDKSATERDKSVTPALQSVTQRDEDVVCLIDCNQENINFKKQSNKQSNTRPLTQKSVARNVNRNANRNADRNAQRDKCYGQLRLPLTYDDPQPELASVRIKDGYRRWVEMRQAHRYYNISLINHLDFLNQLASVCRDYGEDEGLRWIQMQIDNERLNVPDKYQPPPKRTLADWEKPMKPEERCTPEDVAEARRKLGFLK